MRRREEIDRDMVLRVISLQVRLDQHGRPASVQFRIEAQRELAA